MQLSSCTRVCGLQRVLLRIQDRGWILQGPNVDLTQALLLMLNWWRDAFISESCLVGSTTLAGMNNDA